MSKITDAEANATSLDGLVNDNALVPTLRNGPKPSYQYLVDGWNTEFNTLIDNLDTQGDAAIVAINEDVATVESLKNSATSLINSDVTTVDNAATVALSSINTNKETIETAAANVDLTIAELDSKYKLTMLGVDGAWVSGIEFTAYNQYLVYNGTAYQPKPSTNLPYTTGATPNLSDVQPVTVNNADGIILDDGGSVQEYIDGQQFASVDAVKAYSKLSKLTGQRITTGEYHAGTGYGGASYDVVSSGSVTPNDIDIIQGVADSGAAIVLRASSLRTMNSYKFGARNDVDSADILQRCLNVLSVNGGGVVIPPISTIISKTIYLPSNCFLDGVSAITVIKPSNTFTGDSMVDSIDFDDLTGTNSWLNSEGVPYNLGFRNIRIDCNFKEVWGSRLYTKNITTNNFIIENSDTGGFWTECANKGGQSGWEDLPEGNIDVTVRDCLGVSWEMRGPHDQICSRYISRVRNGGETGAIGLRATKVTGEYQGLMDMKFCHIYGHEICMIVQDVSIKGDLFVLESARRSTLIIESSDCLINQVESFGAGRDNYEAYDIQITGSNNRIGHIKGIINNGNQLGLLNVSGSRNIIGINANGSGSSFDGKVAINVTGNDNEITGVIRNFSGVNCVGLQVGGLGATNRNVIDVSIATCSTHLNYITAGDGNDISVRSTLSTGETLHSGARPSRGGRERVSIMASGGVSKNTSESILATDVIDLTVTTEQLIEIPHNSPWQPYPENVSVSELQSSSIDDYGYDYIRLATTGVDNIRVRVKLSIASATTGATSSLIVRF